MENSHDPGCTGERVHFCHCHLDARASPSRQHCCQVPAQNHPLIPPALWVLAAPQHILTPGFHTWLTLAFQKAAHNHSFTFTSWERGLGWTELIQLVWGPVASEQSVVPAEARSEIRGHNPGALRPLLEKCSLLLFCHPVTLIRDIHVEDLPRGRQSQRQSPGYKPWYEEHSSREVCDWGHHTLFSFFFVQMSTSKFQEQEMDQDIWLFLKN
jgi:hypothetical protein